MTAWRIGYESYWIGVRYDPYAPYWWREGWLDAEADDYYWD